jgi:hypothetical protein
MHKYIISKLNLLKIEYLFEFDKDTLMFNLDFTNKKINFSLADMTSISYKVECIYEIEYINLIVRFSNDDDILSIQFPSEYDISLLYVIDIYNKIKEEFQFKHSDEYNQIRLKHYNNEKVNYDGNINRLRDKYEDIWDLIKL